MATSGISSIYANKLRMTGLSSGFDTDSIVQGLLTSQTLKITKAEQAKTKLTWYSEALTNVGNKLKDFRSTYLSALGSNTMINMGTYKSYSVTSNNNNGAVSVSAGAEATSGNITVNSIERLAKNAHTESAGKVSADGTTISDSNLTKLGDLSFANDMGFVDGKVSFSINGKEFSFSSEDTLQKMVNTINADADANVTMTYSRLTDKFTLESKSGGRNSTLEIANISGNVFGENGALGIEEGTLQNGQNAVVTINNVQIERSSNTFEIDGLSFTLNKQTNEETEFRVTQNTDAVYNSIKSFVNAFNDLYGELSGLYSEKTYPSFYPLSSEERGALSETELKEWDAKAKSGLLRNNSDLRSLMSDMRSIFFSDTGGTGKSLADIGISGGNYFLADAGKMVIDEEKLRAAIESNPDEVMQMFMNDGDDNASLDGAARKLFDRVNSYITDEQGDELTHVSKKIDAYDEKIYELNNKMALMSERYYMKYAQMETVLSSMERQSNWMSQQFSALLG